MENFTCKTPTSILVEFLAAFGEELPRIPIIGGVQSFGKWIAGGKIW